MTVFLKFLEDRRRSSLWWGLGIMAAVVFTLAFYPSVKGQDDLDQVLEDLPAGVQAVFGFEVSPSVRPRAISSSGCSRVWGSSCS